MKRTIAAILAADVAGYSRLVAADEEDTLRRLAEYGRIYRECVARFGGRVFNTAGDAILAEFPSAVEALRAALAIQGELAERNAPHPPERRVQFRMGLTIGDVVENDDGDMLGDGVNVAARLEGLAEPGGVCVSRGVQEAVAGKVDAHFRDIGPQNLKNIPRPVHAWRVSLAAPAAAPRRLPRPVLAGATLVALLLAGGGVYWLLRPAPVPEGAALVAGDDRRPYLTVSVARPSRTCFRDGVRMSGTIAPRDAVEVRPEVEGLRVQRVFADPGARVTAGQVIAQLGASPDGTSTQPGSQVRAPVDGTVGRVGAVVGTPASAAGPALFEIAARGDLEFSADVPLSALARLAPGQRVAVAPLGQSGASGRVRAISSSADGATQLGRVRVLLDPAAGASDAGGALRWGTFARGVAAVGERCGPGVPFASIAQGSEGPAVYVANGGRVEARPVTTGLSSGGRVEIRDGLGEGDLVVLKAHPFLREGDLIRPVIAGE